MIGQIEKRADLCDGHALSGLSHFNDFVARTYLAFTEDPEVEPWPTTGRQECRHPGFVHPNTNTITGNARLSNLEQCAADLVTVADAHCIVEQALDREVLAELSMDEVSSVQLLLPIAIRFDLIHEDGSLLTA